MPGSKQDHACVCSEMRTTLLGETTWTRTNVQSGLETVNNAQHRNTQNNVKRTTHKFVFYWMMKKPKGTPRSRAADLLNDTPIVYR